MLIRCLVHTNPIAGSTFWPDITALYMEQLIKAGLDVCAIGLGMSGDLRDSPLVNKFPDQFRSRGLDPYVSLLFSYGVNFGAYLNTAKKRLVLTAARPRAPRPDELESLAKFDYVLAPTMAEADALLLGMLIPMPAFDRAPLTSPRVMAPNAKILKKFFLEEVFPSCQ